MNHILKNKDAFCKLLSYRGLRLGGVAALVASSLFVSCKPGLPDDVIPESSMEKILYDYHVAQAMAETRTDSVGYYRYLYVRSVFEKYGITEAEFDSSMVWYSANASYLAEMYARINERYAAELEALGSTNKVDLYASLSTTGDTANIWHDTGFCLLRPGGISSHYSFTVEADTSFYPGDDILWQFDNFYVCQEGTREAYAALVVRYENDSVASAYQHLSTSTKTELAVRVSGQERIRSLTGFVYFASSDNEQREMFRMMILNNFKLVRFHKKKEDLQADTLLLQKDSLQTDSLVMDSSRLRQLPQRGAQERISPKELRDNQTVERKIRVVKEKPYSTRRLYQR